MRQRTESRPCRDAPARLVVYRIGDGSVALSNSTAPRGITGFASGSTVNLFATTATGLSALTDASGYNATISGTLTPLATAPTNTAFRGLALAPIPEPGTFLSALLGGAGLLALIRRRADAKK